MMKVDLEVEIELGKEVERDTQQEMERDGEDQERKTKKDSSLCLSPTKMRSMQEEQVSFGTENIKVIDLSEEFIMEEMKVESEFVEFLNGKGTKNNIMTSIFDSPDIDYNSGFGNLSKEIESEGESKTKNKREKEPDKQKVEEQKVEEDRETKLENERRQKLGKDLEGKNQYKIENSPSTPTTFATPASPSFIPSDMTGSTFSSSSSSVSPLSSLLSSSSLSDNNEEDNNLTTFWRFQQVRSSLDISDKLAKNGSGLLLAILIIIVSQFLISLISIYNFTSLGKTMGYSRNHSHSHPSNMLSFFFSTNTARFLTELGQKIEFCRKFQHFTSGMLIFGLYKYVVTDSIIASLGLIGGTIIFYLFNWFRSSNEYVDSLYIKIFGAILRKKEKRAYALPAAFYFLLGCTLVVLLFSKFIALAAILALAVGDPFAAIIGILLRSDKAHEYLDREVNHEEEEEDDDDDGQSYNYSYRFKNLSRRSWQSIYNSKHNKSHSNSSSSASSFSGSRTRSMTRSEKTSQDNSHDKKLNKISTSPTGGSNDEGLDGSRLRSSTMNEKDLNVSSRENPYYFHYPAPKSRFGGKDRNEKSIMGSSGCFFTSFIVIFWYLILNEYELFTLPVVEEDDCMTHSSTYTGYHNNHNNNNNRFISIFNATHQQFIIAGIGALGATIGEGISNKISIDDNLLLPIATAIFLSFVL